RPHGLLSWALLKTLRSMPVNQNADRVFLQLRALMQSAHMSQEPVLATTAERRRAPLFGVGTPGSGSVVVAVQKREMDGSVILQGGVASGIRKDAELRRAGDRSGTALQLRITEEQGLRRSRAIAIAGGTTDGVSPGTLFEVVRLDGGQRTRPSCLDWVHLDQQYRSQASGSGDRVGRLDRRNGSG